jgi:hypothetical protein
MYDLICEAFGPDTVKLCVSLLITLLIAAWLVALRREGGMTESWWKYHCRIVGRRAAILGVIFMLCFGYAQQKEEQQQAQQQAVIELFTSIAEVVVSLGESAVSNLRTYLTPEEKKSRLLPVGLATNNLAWVSESQCVTSQVREAWQRVPIRRASFKQALPFPVTVGSNTYEEVFISSSGIIGFDAPRGSELTREMPYEEAADHVYLALLWGRIDFKPRLGSKMWYGVKEDGNFVASYDTVFIDGDTNAVTKVQVEFIAGGDMILRYSDLPPCATNAHVAGFQNLDGGWTLSPDNIRSNTAIYLKAFGPLDLTVQDSDTDGDGISDYYELYPTNGVSITDPCNIDTDADGLMDREEIFTFGTNPGAFSSDGSGTGDLWRVSGGFSPSDAPYTNAAPSGSLGILTITTSLENVATNGGAVLRIADQYIPVLPGTTLVSRIAVPRGATNIFILARGVNCENAVAHVTVDASSFTKIRDPSSVFGWSFTLNPSCVTASGTIVMPAYTITPSVLCYHSPTSSTCRITSADPDIYFWTTQGLVREYTPEPPEIPPNSFSNSTLQVSLVSMDMTLSTLASVTNIPVHLCNPYSGGTNDYPDAPEYDNWCKLVDGEHVWAPGFNATNCPCVLAYTNAYECLCSRDGQKPCACLHGTCDPKAMPQDGSPTNVLGHAALIIGGTNDLLDVEVPGGSLRPCPLCACGLGFSSSASVYRHTSCIHVTPGALTTNGVFSVAGVRPSTNFSDSVFIYKITDCSGSQTVTSYTRKDYTVLGTAVYPTDTGHSVSNWFIGCNVTNDLTLWTGVALPSDSGDVSLTVTVESGTPSPLLYVYNRIAQTNELLITPGQLTFTQNLGAWRNTYCDTNGYVQAYLLCASGGVARVSHSFETYSGQPFFVSCLSTLIFKAWTISIYPKGQVAFAGSSTNILYSLEPGSWTNCVWTISSTADLLADGLTSTPIYPFYVGTNVWVNPGTVGTNFTITCSAVGFAGLDAKAGLVVSREIAWTPKGKSIYVWEPINDGNFATNFLATLCSSETYQGWSYSTTNPVTYFSDSDPTDDDCETCTLANFKGMVNGGIIAVLTHGDTGTLEVVRFASESVANTWKGSEPNMYVIASSNSASIFATAAWFQNNWKNSLTESNSIVFISACHAADGYDSIASSVGGRTVFAPHGSPSGPQIDESYQIIISLMNGTFYPHKNYQRVACNAYALATEPVKALISYFGSGLSTLCPAPQSVFPLSSAQVKARWGCILFDSYMDGSVSAGTAVVQKTGTVGVRSWGCNLSGSFFIDFLHSGTGASVEALGDKCRSAGSAQGQPLDGDGIAPMPMNGQSKEWSW